MKAVLKQDRCEPSEPAPQQTNEPCTGTFTMECCCPMLQTRTSIVQIGPQTEASLQTFLQNTVNSYENAGYNIIGHSIADTGAGWLLGLTVGWHA